MRTRNNARRFRLAAAFATLAWAAVVAAPAEAGGREAITLWWVIFNNPQACGDFCDGDDLANPAVEPAVVYASGAIARGGSRLRLVASLYEQAPGFVDEVIGGPGLLDSEKAEIHLVVRSHGRRLREQRLEQITRFLDASCDELGGPNVCRDIQFAVHAPGEDVSESKVFWFPDLEGGKSIGGASSYLFRDADGVRVVVETRIQ